MIAGGSTQEGQVMKAAVMHEFGDPGVLKHEDVETPKPRPGHVLIKVLAAAEEWKQAPDRNESSSNALGSCE